MPKTALLDVPVTDDPDHTGSAADERVGRVVAKLDKLAERDGVSRTAVAIAFVMRHPAAPIPIIGTQNPARIAAAPQALRVNLSRADWYGIVAASQGAPLP